MEDKKTLTVYNMLTSRWARAGLLGVIILLGFSLRLYSAASSYLWQDEAESAIYAMQILEDGYPNKYFDGLPLYENRSFVPINDPKYALESTNFLVTDLMRNKGWLPHYAMATSIALFGQNTLAVRLPALLISVLSMLIIYFLAKRLFDKKIALVATFLQAFNYNLIVYYDYQARYYAWLVFLSLLFLYILWRWREDKRWLWWYLTIFILVIAFYVHIVFWLALLPMVAITIWHNYKDSFWKQGHLWLGAFILLTSVIPWLVLVNFWSLPLENFVNIKPGYWGNANFFWLVFLSALTLFFFFYNLVVWMIWRRWPMLKLFKSTPSSYLWHFLIISWLVIYAFTPLESFGPRHLVFLVPIILLLITANLIRMRKTIFKLDALMAIFGLSIGYIMMFVFFSSQVLLVWSPFYQATISEIDKLDLVEDTEIYLSFRPEPIWFYSEYRPERFFSIHMSYFEQTKSPLVFISHVAASDCKDSYHYPEACHRIGQIESLAAQKGCSVINTTFGFTVYNCAKNS